MFTLVDRDERLEGQVDVSCARRRRKERGKDMVQLPPALWRQGAALSLKKSVVGGRTYKPVHLAQGPTQSFSQLTLADFYFGLGDRAKQHRFFVNLIVVASPATLRSLATLSETMAINRLFSSFAVLHLS